MNTVNWILTLFFMNNSIISARCDKTLDKKWEDLRAPFLRKRALEITKKQILNVLGLDEFPSRDRRYQRPHTFMLDLYKTLSRGATRWKSKRPTRGVINTVHGLVDQEVYDRSLSQQYHQLYVFDLSTTMLQKEQLVASELRILRRPVPQNAAELISEYGTVFKAVIHMKKRIPFSVRQIPYKYQGLEPIDSFTFDITDGEEKWYVLTVTKALKRWQHSSNKMQSLQLTIQSVVNGKYVSPVQLGFSKEKRSHRNRALLVVFSNDGKGKIPTAKNAKKETRKSTDQWMDVSHSDTELEGDSHLRVKRRSRRRRKKYQCRVKSLWVDFQKLDWGSWVIAPNGYEAGICEGACKFPLDEHLRPSNHATVQTILNTVDPLATPPVCCIPNILAPISILYNDPGGNIKYKKYKDMSVKRCGCS